MSSGWTGPGARSAPQNQQDLENYNAIKARVEADEKEKRDAENARRISLGQKPRMNFFTLLLLREFGTWADDGGLIVKDSMWKKVKNVIHKSRLLD